MRDKKSFIPDRILSYFKAEWVVLLIITISGLIYNLGLLLGPFFEGKMTGCLVNILGGSAVYTDMLILVIYYVLSIGIVQVSRYIKRFYVRRFANNVNKRMKTILYDCLVHKSRVELESEGVGDVMTKAILDVDDCAEGMRKFTTEIFDTGVAMVAYAGMLLTYDWRLAILSMIFPPISYIIAEKMKVIVQKTGAEYKRQSGILSNATLDRAVNGITYRVYGCEEDRQKAYENNLAAYEKSAIYANIWNSSLTPLYRVISMTSVIFILYFGSKNVLGMGWKSWDVAAFATFIACFTKLSNKSANAAKLFNAVHKAQVSWNRIKPLLKPEKYDEEETLRKDSEYPVELETNKLCFKYPDGKMIYKDVTFKAQKGQIIGVTGEVACGKSTFGKTFLCEYAYMGNIKFNGKELSDMNEKELSGVVGYQGHDPELFNDSVKNNIQMGDDIDTDYYLKMVCLDKEVNQMEEGIDTLVGNGGVRLSGGQAARLALARTLAHKKPVMILDDPFSALDKDTEKKVYENIREYAKDSLVILISHRLYMFSDMDKVIWMQNGNVSIDTHNNLLKENKEYAELYNSQT